MPATTPPLIERVGPYRITGTLGSGGMGTVYRALQESLQRTVALKIVNPESASDPRFQERFLAEARAMAQVNSPHVVSCFDAGLADGILFMALELVSGGDLLGLLGRKGGRLGEQLALSLFRDCLEGLEAIEAAKLVHRDLKPANIFITEQGSAKLADLGLARTIKPTGDRTTMAGMILGTPAYISPEQARGEDDLDIRTDLYSLGATLFHLVSGSTPYPASDPLATLVRVLNDPVPDVREQRPDVSEPVAILIRKLLAKERTQRPPSARAARELVEGLLRGQVATARGTRDDRTPQATAVLPELTPPPTALNQTGPATAATMVATTRATTKAMARIDPNQLIQLAKRIIVDQGGLRASLALAPGASFPRQLLDQLLAVSGISYGLIEENLVAAGRPADLPRRITLAKGDAPTPDAAGKDVRGDVVPPVDQSVVIRIADDHMQAAALYRPGKPPQVDEVRAALTAAGVVAGLDLTAIMRFSGKPPSGGKLVVAKGTPAQPPGDAGFVVTPSPTGDHGLYPVEPGLVVATWRESSPGQPGCDVRGVQIPVAEPREPEPEQQVGPGVELGRTRDGDLCLRATRAGVVQHQPDGLVRVVGVLEIPGDLDASNPITTDDVVVVRGSVLAGAKLASTSDIVIVGNLADAQISAGGDLEVQGTIGAGDELRAAGTVVAAAVCDRRILGGNIRISGTISNCDLIATGSIMVDNVVGGSLAAGGDIQATSVGASNGVPTVIWAGHHQSLDRQSDLIKLEEARIAGGRAAKIATGIALQAKADELAKRTDRLAKAQFVKPEILKAAQEEIARLTAEQSQIRAQVETERQRLMETRHKREEIDGRTAGAKVAIGGVAYDGVTIRIGDREPQLLSEPRVRPVF